MMLGAGLFPHGTHCLWERQTSHKVLASHEGGKRSRDPVLSQAGCGPQEHIPLGPRRLSPKAYPRPGMGEGCPGGRDWGEAGGESPGREAGVRDCRDCWPWEG